MSNTIHFIQDRFSKNYIRFILLIGFLNGLIFVWIVPPWEHYDEPTHFEYAWLIAHRLKLPKLSDSDTRLGLEVGKSLNETGFFERRGSWRPNTTDPSQPLWLGYSQLSDPPLYYILAAVPLFLFQNAPVAWQLYAGRVFTLVFLLLTIYAAYLLTCEFTPVDHPLRKWVPMLAALLPGFVDFMTAINDYSAAIGFLSLWIVVAVRLLKRKWSLHRAILLLGLTVACVATQEAVYYVVPLALLVLFLSLLPRGKEWIGWAGCLVALSAGLGFAFEWKDAAFWLRNINQAFSTRTTASQVSNFQFALQGKSSSDQFWGRANAKTDQGFFQLVPEYFSRQLKGKKITVGAWMWADRAIPGYGPGINALNQFQDQWLGFQPVALTTTPQFVASSFNVPEKQDRIQLWLRTTSPATPDARIYFSGVVMSEGEMPVGVAPTMNESGSEGVWAGTHFSNVARNGLFTLSWPYLRSDIASLISKQVTAINPMVISSFIALPLDYPGTEWYIIGTTNRIFRTFWALFGWANVPLSKVDLIPRPYFVLLIITLVGIGGSIVPLVKYFRSEKSAGIFLLIVMMGMIGIAYLYGVYTMGGALRFRAYLPVARYIYPAILPILFVLASGWQWALAIITRTVRLPAWLPGMVMVIFLVLLDVYSIFSNLSYYAG